MAEREGPEASDRPGLVRRLGPVLGGMLLDLVDLATFGPAGLYGGFLVGAAVGWWVARELGWSRRARALAALAAAVYSATPATEVLPLGTLTGLYLRWRGSGGVGR